MRIITQNTRQRVVYAFKEEISEGVFEYFLSPVDSVTHGRRPIARFDTKQELEMVANNRNCKIEWL